MLSVVDLASITALKTTNCVPGALKRYCQTTVRRVPRTRDDRSVVLFDGDFLRIIRSTNTVAAGSDIQPDGTDERRNSGRCKKSSTLAIYIGSAFERLLRCNVDHAQTSPAMLAIRRPTCTYV